MKIVQSRRTFLKLAAADSAATMPAVALAEPDRLPVDPARPIDEEQLDNCIAELKAILARMHPNVTKHSMQYSALDDGTYRIWTHSEREFLPWTGPGLYRVSMQGYLMDFWLEKVQRRGIGGIVYREEIEAWHWLDDEEGYWYEPRRMSEPQIVAKLNGQAPPWVAARRVEG